MAKELQKQIDEMLGRIRDKYTDVEDRYARTKEFKDVAQDMAAQVKKRTRLGKGVSDDGDQVPLEALESDAYKDLRKRFKRNLSSETRPGKSNLTATGQLLNNIASKIEGSSIVLYFKDKRDNDLTGRPSKITNSKLAGYVQDNGRRFFELTKAEFNRFSRQIRDDIIKLIKKK